MKDIKTKNKIVQEKVEKITTLFVHENKELRAEVSSFGKYMFIGMFFSVGVYLFFVTSSIFFAVNTQKYSYEIESLNNLAVEEIKKPVLVDVGSESENESEDKDKIRNFSHKKELVTYINRNSDTAISLK